MRRLVTGRWLVVDIVVLAAVIALAVVAVIRQSQPAGPPWIGDQSGCRRPPMEHVHDPQRLQLLASCSTVSGVVTDLHYVAAFDDLKVTITPDEDLTAFLDEANQGRLVLDVIATDQASVGVPAIGSRVTAWGSWVQDKATHATMMLPVYRMDMDRQSDHVRGESIERHGPAPDRELRLTARASGKVVVGGRLDVFLQTTWLHDGRAEPASEIRLFSEMTTASGGGVHWKTGVGVRWKAAMTDTRGIAVLHLVAIQVPGPYLLTVYAAPSGQAVTATVPIKIAKA